MTAPAATESGTTDTVANTEPDSAGQSGAGDPAGADQLGDAGQKALEHIKQQRNALRTELNAYKGLGLSAEEMKALIGKSQEDATRAEQQRVIQEAEGAALAKANQRLVRAEITAAATGRLANPALALKLLDLSEFEVNDDGEVDSAAINGAIDELIKKEPYLSAQGGKRFQGTADAGARGTAGKPQLTREDLKKMTPDQILTAKSEGLLNGMLGIK